MISEWLKARTQEWNDLADAQERAAQPRTITLQVRLDSSGLADQTRRGQMSETLAEFDKRYLRR